MANPNQTPSSLSTPDIDGDISYIMTGARIENIEAVLAEVKLMLETDASNFQIPYSSLIAEAMETIGMDQDAIADAVGDIDLAVERADIGTDIHDYDMDLQDFYTTGSVFTGAVFPGIKRLKEINEERIFSPTSEGCVPKCYKHLHDIGAISWDPSALITNNMTDMSTRAIKGIFNKPSNAVDVATVSAKDKTLITNLPFCRLYKGVYNGEPALMCYVPNKRMQPPTAEAGGCQYAIGQFPIGSSTRGIKYMKKFKKSITVSGLMLETPLPEPVPSHDAVCDIMHAVVLKGPDFIKVKGQRGLYRIANIAPFTLTTEISKELDMHQERLGKVHPKRPEDLAIAYDYETGKGAKGSQQPSAVEYGIVGFNGTEYQRIYTRTIQIPHADVDDSFLPTAFFRELSLDIRIMMQEAYLLYFPELSSDEIAERIFNTKTIQMFAHNGARFDSLLNRKATNIIISKALEKGNNIFQSTIEVKDAPYNIKFIEKDTVKFSLMSLDKSCKAFMCEYNKMEFDIVGKTKEYYAEVQAPLHVKAATEARKPDGSLLYTPDEIIDNAWKNNITIESLDREIFFAQTCNDIDVIDAVDNVIIQATALEAAELKREKEWRLYLDFDVQALANLMFNMEISFREINCSITNFLGIPGMAYYVMRINCHGLDNSYRPTSQSLTTFLNSSSKGGRVQCFKNLGEQLKNMPLHCRGFISADATSLYPTVMAMCGFPVGKIRKISDDVLKRCKRQNREGDASPSVFSVDGFNTINNSPHYIIEATLKFPNARYGIIPYKTEDGMLIYPSNNEYTDVWNDVDIREAIKQGAIVVNVDRGVYWNRSEKIFKHHIESLFDKRMAYKMLGRGHPEFFKEYILKIILNASFGKHGEINKTRVIYHNGTYKNNMNYVDVSSTVLANGQTRLVQRKVFTTTDKSCHLAGYILAYARAFMNEAITTVGVDKQYYGDTDSFYGARSDFKTRRDTPMKFKLSSEKKGGMGTHKNDHGDGVIIKMIMAIDGKRYLVFKKSMHQILLKDIAKQYGTTPRNGTPSGNPCVGSAHCAADDVDGSPNSRCLRCFIHYQTVSDDLRAKINDRVKNSAENSEGDVSPSLFHVNILDHVDSGYNLTPPAIVLDAIRNPYTLAPESKFTASNWEKTCYLIGQDMNLHKKSLESLELYKGEPAPYAAKFSGLCWNNLNTVSNEGNNAVWTKEYDTVKKQKVFLKKFYTDLNDLWINKLKNNVSEKDYATQTISMAHERWTRACDNVCIDMASMEFQVDPTRRGQWKIIDGKPEYYALGYDDTKPETPSVCVPYGTMDKKFAPYSCGDFTIEKAKPAVKDLPARPPTITSSRVLMYEKLPSTDPRVTPATRFDRDFIIMPEHVIGSTHSAYQSPTGMKLVMKPSSVRRIKAQPDAYGKRLSGRFSINRYGYGVEAPMQDRFVSVIAIADTPEHRRLYNGVPVSHLRLAKAIRNLNNPRFDHRRPVCGDSNSAAKGFVSDMKRTDQHRQNEEAHMREVGALVNGQ